MKIWLLQLHNKLFIMFTIMFNSDEIKTKHLNIFSGKNINNGACYSRTLMYGVTCTMYV